MEGYVSLPLTEMDRRRAGRIKGNRGRRHYCRFREWPGTGGAKPGSSAGAVRGSSGTPSSHFTPSGSRKESFIVGKCLGRCFWVQYETKWPESSSISIEFRGPQSIPDHLMPTTKDLTDLVNRLMAEYNRRGKRVRVDSCEKGCESQPLTGNGIPWTEWKRLPFRRILVKERGREKIEYAVTGEVEIRKRVLEGVCLEREL